jgi:hypothetical protein
LVRWANQIRITHGSILEQLLRPSCTSSIPWSMSAWRSPLWLKQELHKLLLLHDVKKKQYTSPHTHWGPLTKRNRIECDCRVGLAQLVRFLVVELTYSGLNAIFDMSVIFTANYFFRGSDVSVDSDTFLVTDFVNLKIKSVQSFGGAHRNRVCMFL